MHVRVCPSSIDPVACCEHPNTFPPEAYTRATALAARVVAVPGPQAIRGALRVPDGVLPLPEVAAEAPPHAESIAAPHRIKPPTRTEPRIAGALGGETAAVRPARGR
jgi:hypothetical protein